MDAVRDAQRVADSLAGPAQTTTVDLLCFSACKAALLAVLVSVVRRRLERALKEGLVPTAETQSRAQQLMALAEEGEAEPKPGWLETAVQKHLVPLVQALTRPAPGPDMSHLGRVPVACADKLMELCGDPPPVLSRCVVCANRHRKALREVCGPRLDPVCGID